MSFNNIFKNKNVLITGHTGFKGAWLSIWLNLLGANVYGFSIDDPTQPSHFKIAKLRNILKKDIRSDIRNYKDILSTIKIVKPDFIFHLAAQSIVKKSISSPLLTWQTNLIGSINILESLKQYKKKCAVVMITSDKCYENNEWIWGYRENDKLGGNDPYCASKASAEIAIKSYSETYFSHKKNMIHIATARAGNVIGGGDWSNYRLVPDCIKNWSKNKLTIIRNSNSTRPWQNVLEPISGYLTLAQNLYFKKKFHKQSYNFGPSSEEIFSVIEIVNKLSKYWVNSKWKKINTKNNEESVLLKLNCDKALVDLKWKSVMSIDQNIDFTMKWYINYFKSDYTNILKFSENQIKEYTKLAKLKKLKWVKNI